MTTNTQTIMSNYIIFNNKIWHLTKSIGNGVNGRNCRILYKKASR